MNTRNPNIPTIFLPTANGTTVKAPDTSLTHSQNLFIQELSHGANKGKFTSMIEEIKWRWSRGWWAFPPLAFMREKQPKLWAKFDEVNN